MTTLKPKDALTLSDLVGSTTLRTYLRNVRDWHGYVRFLGLPDRRDNPDVLIDRLFVEPLVVRRHVSPDEDPSKWLGEAQTIFDVLKVGKPTVLLGDPGTGKSTLLNYLAWLLARPTVDAWSKRMGPWLLPLPMLLRELRLHGVTSFRGLLDAFLGHAMSKPLRKGKYLKNMLEQGRVLILLDGIDEIADIRTREALRDAVVDGVDRYPRCRWLLTSRIVGYDEAPFDSGPKEAKGTTRVGVRRQVSDLAGDGVTVSRQGEMLWERDIGQGADGGPIVRRYIAPFDDARIEAFARNWYVQREAAATRAGVEAAHLVRAVHADEAILRLSRVPNLLTMMALIHRIEATLPHGRALLYERIGEAYLESIDRFRGVYSSAYNLTQKKRWLGRLGYEMQKRRSAHGEGGSGTGGAELLADAVDVLGWLREEMKHGSVSGEMSAEEFLDVVGRRSGLFLPRGEGRYAFVHLSFQEYFAAVALEREVTSLHWARNRTTPLGLERQVLAEWATQSMWRETVAFLCELMADREDWYADVLDTVFGEGFGELEKEVSDATVNLAELLARLVVNPRAGMTGARSAGALVGAVRTALRRELSPTVGSSVGESVVFRSLFVDDSAWNARVLNVVAVEMEREDVRELSLGKTRIANLEPLRRVGPLEALNVRHTQIADVAPLADLRSLELLDVSETQISDLQPLEKLIALEYLDLLGTRVSDIGPLAGLTALTYLHLGRTGVTNIGPLAGLGRLEQLYLGGTAVQDVGPLAKLGNLKRLALWDNPVRDLGPVAGLTELDGLFVSRTRIRDLSPLRGLTKLGRLLLWETEIADLSALAGLTSLWCLAAAGTRVSDVTPLASLRKLRELELGGTMVVDLGPLGNLAELKELDLGGTPVEEVSALGGLRSLKSLNLSRTRVRDISALTGLASLKRVGLRGTRVTAEMVKVLKEALPKCDVLW